MNRLTFPDFPTKFCASFSNCYQKKKKLLWNSPISAKKRECYCMIHALEDNITTIYWLYGVKIINCRYINVRENFCCSKENILKILQLHPNPDVVTNLDFNFCYWIPRNEIVHFVKQCKNLTELAVAHSTIGSQELEEILCENVHVTKLSFSIHDSEGFAQNEKLVNYYLNQTTVWEDPLSFLHLGKCRQILAKLETLELHMGQYPIILATLIR